MILATSLLAAGFPSPADDHREGELSVAELVGEGSPSVFFVRAESGALPARGILRGDLLVVDRARTPRPGDPVLVVADEEIRLAEMPRGEETEVWGVVTFIIREMRHVLRPR